MYCLDCIFNSFFVLFASTVIGACFFYSNFKLFPPDDIHWTFPTLRQIHFRVYWLVYVFLYTLFFALPFCKLIPRTMTQVPALFIIMYKVIKFISSDYMVLDERETGTDSTNNPGPPSRRVADVPTDHAIAPKTEPWCVLDAGDSDNISHPVATKLNATGLYWLPKKIKMETP
jgi:hypothetical protein